MEALLTSETFVKSVMSISDNIAGKYIQPSIREAQDIGLRNILGGCLTDKLKDLVARKTIREAGNEAYAELLDQAQYYLAYATVCEIIPKVSYKVANFGVSKSSDDNLQVATHDDVERLQYYYQSKADYYCILLQQWIVDNAELFPELGACGCARIKSNLHTAASSGIWLGGPRGKSSAAVAKIRRNRR